MATRTWFITGVNRGLGRCLAEAPLERGDRVAGTARNAAELDGLKATYGDRLWTASLDLTDAGGDQKAWSIGRSRTWAASTWWSTTPATSLVGAAEECTEEMIRHLLDTNLLGSILVVKAALPHLRAQGGGRILQVSSSLGQFGLPGHLALRRLEVGDRGVHRVHRAGRRAVRDRVDDRRTRHHPHRLRCGGGPGPRPRRLRRHPGPRHPAASRVGPRRRGTALDGHGGRRRRWRGS